MAQAPAKFLAGNLFRHVTVMSLTGSVGLMAIFLVDLANLLFIAMLGRPELAAAVGYGGAVMFVTTSIGVGMSISAGALAARALGAGDPAGARRRASHALAMAVLFGIALSGLVWAGLRPITGLLGASGPTQELTIHFLAIVIPSTPFLMVGMIGGAILRAHGDARRAMSATLWGALVAAVLDPILIFGLDLDLTGAAIATVISRMVIAAVAMGQVVRHHGGFIRPTLPGLRADFAAVAAIALPAILTQVATPLGQAIVTRAMSTYGEAAVAGMAIAGRLTPVAFGVIFALSGAIGPIIGQNAGASRPDRVRQAFFAGLKFAALVILTVAALLFILRNLIADAFQAEGLTRELVLLFCGPLALLWYFIAIVFVANAAFNNLGRPFVSTWTNWTRSTVGTLVPVWIGGQLGGAVGILWGQALGGVVFGLLSLWLALRIMPRPA